MSVAGSELWIWAGDFVPSANVTWIEVAPEIT